MPSLLTTLQGYGKWLFLMAGSVHIWLGGALALFKEYLKDPHGFLARKDRSTLEFPDPFPGLEHFQMAVNGVRLHVVRAGVPAAPRSKPLLLFVHGFPELWYSWRHQLAAFRDDYEVAAFDMRGYGESERPQGRRQYRLDKLADDIVALIHHLGREKVILVAHDWGGVVAWRVAMQHPEVVEKLAILAAPHPVCFRKNMDEDQKKRSQYMWYFQAPWLPETALLSADLQFLEQAFQKHPLMAPRRQGAISDEDVERYKKAFGVPGAMTAALNYYRAAVDGATWNPPPKGRSTGGRVSVPTLVLWGDSDEALGTQLVRRLGDYVPDLELHVLKDCSHWIQQDRPDEVNKLLKAFITRPVSARL